MTPLDRAFYWLAVRYHAVSCHLAEMRGDKSEEATHRCEVKRLESRLELDDFQRRFV